MTFHIYAFGFFLCRALSTNLIAFVLSTCAGAGGRGWSISIRKRRTMDASWHFSNAEAIFHSAHEDAMFLMIFVACAHDH